MVKRIIGILLSFCMTAVFVSGCGENAENPDTADNSGGKGTISAESSSELLTITVVEVPKLAKEQVIGLPLRRRQLLYQALDDCMGWVHRERP